MEPTYYNVLINGQTVQVLNKSAEHKFVIRCEMGGKVSGTVNPESGIVSAGCNAQSCPGSNLGIQFDQGEVLGVGVNIRYCLFLVNCMRKPAASIEPLLSPESP